MSFALESWKELKDEVRKAKLSHHNPKWTHVDHDRQSNQSFGAVAIEGKYDAQKLYRTASHPLPSSSALSLNSAIFFDYLCQRKIGGERLMVHLFNTTSDSQPRWRNYGPLRCRYCIHGNLDVALMSAGPDSSDSASLERSEPHQNASRSPCESHNTHSDRTSKVPPTKTSLFQEQKLPAGGLWTSPRQGSPAFVATQNRSVFISGVPCEGLKDEFDGFLRRTTGYVSHIQLHRQDRGRGRVTSAVAWYGAVEEAQVAIRVLHGHRYKGRQLQAREGRDSEVTRNVRTSSRSDCSRPLPPNAPPIANGSGIRWQSPDTSDIADAPNEYE